MNSPLMKNKCSEELKVLSIIHSPEDKQVVFFHVVIDEVVVVPPVVLLVLAQVDRHCCTVVATRLEGLS